MLIHNHNPYYRGECASFPDEPGIGVGVCGDLDARFVRETRALSGRPSIVSPSRASAVGELITLGFTWPDCALTGSTDVDICTEPNSRHMR
jgi:hypothetical protein